MQHRHLLLASQSPRRRQILSISGYEFEVLSTQISEIPDENLNLCDQIRQLAADKARACLKMRKPLKQHSFLVLAADTVVVLADQILGKPKDENEARSFLRRLSGQSHQVITGISMIDSETSIEFLGHEVTDVQFRDLSPVDIETYVASGEPFDKAGGYGIQGAAANFVSSLHGSYDNVVGLPMQVVSSGIDFFKHQIPGFTVKSNQRRSELEQRIDEFTNQVRGHGNPDARLIAVSKKKPATDIVMAWLAGQRDFGENYVQEALEKRQEVELLLRTLSPKPSEVRWHYIGTLQTKKVRAVVGEFDLIHSVDRLSLAEEVSKRAISKNIVQPILLQLNFAEESTKSGAKPKEFRDLALKVSKLEGVSLRGLMALPPLLQSEAETRIQFREIVDIFLQTRAALPALQAKDFKEISLGTTHDFKIALEAGATMVRIGTAIFGAREPAELA